MTNCYFENSEDHSYAYSYDNYGNRFEKKAYSNNAVLERYTWTRGRLLEKIANGSNVTIGQYTYDLNGVRYTKTAGGVTTTYFYDGNTLTGENRSDGKRLRYFYDTTGLCGFSYFNGSETQYYTYVKDVLGNIVMIKDHLGLLMTKYTYDEWGNCTVNNLVGTIGNVNPFRYRGYYFDSESGLYYLMSRYYDPEIGQFISMDTSDYLDPETIGGMDLYAYCGNNPVMRKDPTGHFWGLIFQAGVSLGVYAVMSIVSLFNEDVREDIETIGTKFFNDNPSVVQNANVFSFYKGVPVIKNNWDISLSFGFIFLNQEDDLGKFTSTLNHEYGHSIQLMLLGPKKYLFFIAIPSFTGSVLSLARQINNHGLGAWIYNNYYNLPWERTADLFGGVYHTSNIGEESVYHNESVIMSLLYFLLAMFI